MKVTVSTTCGRWRKLALDTRGLWSTVVFEQLATSHHSEEHSISVLRLFLARSRDAPINLTISCGVAINVDRLHKVLVKHWRKVRTLSIRAVGPHPPFRPPYFFLTSLESLRCHDGTFEPHNIVEVVADMSDGPSLLERLSLTGRRVDNMLLLSLVPSSIRFLKIQGPKYTDHVLNFISTCSALETLCLATSIELRNIACASLTNLTLVGPVALAMLNVNIAAPNLKHLSVICPLTDDNISLQFQQSASRAIFPSLHTLTVVRPNIMRVHSLIVNLVQSNPSIIAIHLGDLNSNSPANTLRGVVSHSPTFSGLPPGISEFLGLHPGAHALLPLTLQTVTLTPDDAPNLQFLRIEVASHLFRDRFKVEDLVSVTASILHNRDKLRIEWYCNDLGEDDPASARWLESKLLEEVIELRDGPLGGRFSISLATHAPPLAMLYPVGVTTRCIKAPLEPWLNEGEGEG